MTTPRSTGKAASPARKRSRPSRETPPWRPLVAFLALLAVVYGLVYFTGPKTLEPKLGIDLQGGTRVTLTARTEDGKEPTRSQLDQAKQIIEQRVNGLGVAGSEVVVTGNNLVITVPGQDGAQAKSLGQTARLYVRPVIGAVPATPQPPKPEEPEDDKSTDGTPTEEAAAAIAEQRKLRQAPGDASQQQLEALQQYMSKIDCSPTANDPLLGNDKPDEYLVACSTDGKEVYLLGPQIIDGRDIKDAAAGTDPQTGEWVVTLEFKGKAASFWPKYTAQEAPNRTQTAFTLDSRVVSAPAINEPIPGGQTRISGSSADPFTEASSNELANVLKYGSLPLSFNASDAETVSATLGLSSLRAGLIAGAIGLIAVFLYALAYYRMLGILTILSLVLSGAMVYGIIVLLGRWIGFTLDLAGIAGLIIGIGMTADSFVVYFERIKDEIREGRSFRSAVPRGWASARRTIWSGNAVSFIAAAVIYILAIGEVRGFAFTLGLTTILDVMVVFLVTHPLVVLASRSSFMSKPSVNGLGAVAEVARERKVAARRQAAAKAGATAAGATSSNPDTDTSEKGSAR
ncbi:protein translocase subunit SecD [Gordonia paraffinivorans]|uniref:Protein translocase subunit SecD n=1 Tax=Gordonia paraffinivorans TaxID=175628 RepID=A0ABD7UZE3_9ACTN|nr:protein translocase subunit SecD [Gordonia paraffinivorans]MBY4572348.1 protein translocase subunit SecD [Gordonia paraffinivorans]MCD2144348.1 protein translocase subunit SecD [Gordonia paraffinivorans]VFA82185.1 preprotein translocase subunit SecD [Gordonia paraffinivorans]